MQVFSEWPGTVREILVAIDDAVQVDDEVVIIESMKMLTPVPSTAAGRVSAIHVSVGDVIDEGAALITLE